MNWSAGTISDVPSRFVTVISTEPTAWAGAVAVICVAELTVNVAAGNAASFGKILKSPVEFRLGSLLAPLGNEMLHAVVCNPPYVSFAELADLPRDVRDWEPCLALLSPQDGLSLTHDLVKHAPHSQVEIDQAPEVVDEDARHHGRANIAQPTPSCGARGRRET